MLASGLVSLLALLLQPLPVLEPTLGLASEPAFPPVPEPWLVPEVARPAGPQRLPLQPCVLLPIQLRLNQLRH